MGVASIEAEEAVASSLLTCVSGVLDRSSHTHMPHTMCVQSDDRDRLTMSWHTDKVLQVWDSQDTGVFREQLFACTVEVIVSTILVK